MEQSDLYRKESMDRIQSPEQLNDYLRITNPSVWVVLGAVIFDDDAQIQNIRSGMTVTVGDTASPITSVGWNADGRLFALADTTLADGVYEARVIYRQTQVLKLLFN